MTTAFVLSGGAALGATQVGMAWALTEAGIRPDLIVGTSVGAVNGAWLASRCDLAGVQGLAEIWTHLHRRQVFPLRPARALLGLVGHSPSLFPNTGLRRLLSRHLDFDQLEDAPIPLHVTVTDLLTGTDICVSRGDTVAAVLASAAIPGAFPPVEVDGRLCVDGGIVNNTPITHAVELGADTIWVLSTGQTCALHRSPRSALTIGLHALSSALNQRLAWDVTRFEAMRDVFVVPPLCPVHTAPADFGQAAALIARARQLTADWLPTASCRHGQAALLAPHGHADVATVGAA